METMDPLANDPIMWEVDDGTGNAHVETKKKIKSKSKGSTLLNKIKGGDNPHDGVPHKRTGKKMSQKEIERREYGNLDSSEEEMAPDARALKEKGFFSDVKWTHIAVLAMMMGGALIPFVMMTADILSAHIPSALPNFQPIMVNLGLVSTPKKRLTAFYDKHKPEKMKEVDEILLKYAGNYPKMLKRLESKYQDHGYFIGWEDDTGVADAKKKTYDFITKTGGKYYQKYVPFPVKQAMNKAYISGLYWAKRGYKLLDKWTTPGGGGAEKKKTAGKSRRARNRESRD